MNLYTDSNLSGAVSGNYIVEDGSNDIYNIEDFDGMTSLGSDTEIDCSEIIYDLYIADKYDCTTEASIGTAIIAFPTGTSVNYTKFYNSDTDIGLYAYKPSSTSASGPGLIMNTTPYDTVLIACPIGIE